MRAAPRGLSTARAHVARRRRRLDVQAGGALFLLLGDVQRETASTSQIKNYSCHLLWTSRDRLASVWR